MTLLDTVDKWISGDWGAESSTSDENYEVACIRGADIVPVSAGDTSEVPKRYVSKQSVEKHRLQGGDIVVEKSGGSPTQSTGRTLRITDELVKSRRDVVCSNFCEAFRVKKEWDSDYIFYFIQSIYNQGAFFNFEGKTSGLKNLNVELAYSSIPVPKVSFANQRKIGKFLSSIDRLIQLSRKRIENLEKLAREIYDYWFVQFDFPDEHGKPYKSSGGKMAYNAQLKREIPAGWEVSPIESVCKVVDCLHSKKPDYKFEDESSYLLTLDNLTKDGYIDLSDKFYISKSDYAYWVKNIEVQENDFVVTNAGRAGDVGRIQRGIKCAAGRNMTVIRPFLIDPYYLRGYFKSDMTNVQIQGGLEQGSLFANFNVRTIRKLLILLPPTTIMKLMCPIMRSLIQQIDASLAEISQLTSLREFLLPLLMNGQAKMGGVE